MTRRPRRSGRRDSPDGLGGEQVEGRQAVRELLRARSRRVHHVMVVEGGEAATGLAEIIEMAGALGVPVRRVARAHLESAALTEAPQGVVARAEPVRDVEIGVLAERTAGEAPFLVVLDGVTDPHNLGAVMRSALCAGVTGIVIGSHRAARLSPSAVKAAAGAVEYLRICSVAGIPAALTGLRSAGVWTVGLDSGGPVGLWDLPISTEPLALVLGAEGRGLSRLVKQRCELLAAIPMSGPLESLNISAAAALACFEVARRRSRSSD